MTTDQQHTPEPWEHNALAPRPGDREQWHFACAVWADNGTIPICSTRFSVGRYNEVDERTQDANARRIVACVNACAGISDNELTHGPVIALSRYSTLANEKAELIEALRALVVSLEWEEQRSGTTYAGFDNARAILAKVQP